MTKITDEGKTEIAGQAIDVRIEDSQDRTRPVIVIDFDSRTNTSSEIKLTQYQVVSLTNKLCEKIDELELKE